MNMVRRNSQVQADTALKEASNYGLQAVDTGFNNVVADENQALELLEYRKSMYTAVKEQSYLQSATR